MVAHIAVNFIDMILTVSDAGRIQGEFATPAPDAVVGYAAGIGAEPAEGFM